MVKLTLRPRAQRFPIETFVRFRASGDTHWSEGTTVNISRSGVLFYAPKALRPKTKIEMRIIFPTVLIVCWGSVSRTEPATSGNARSALAAVIIDYALTRVDDDVASGRKRYQRSHASDSATPYVA